MSLLVIISFSVFTAGSVEAAEVAWLLMANSRYFYAAPTVVLEVKYKPPVPQESTDNQDGTVITSDDEREQTQTGQNEGEPDDSYDMAVSSGDNDEQHQEQQDQQDQQAGGDDDNDAGVVPPHHNALIISRLLTENNSLHTEINVDNITSQDSVFIDVFSGDLQLAAQSGDIETADSVFISFENEEGTIETVRIGIEAEQGGGIDKITILDGISERTSELSEPPVVDNDSQAQTEAAPQDSLSQDSLSDSLLAFEQIKSPIILITPDGRYMYFEDGRELKMHVFSKDYEIGERL